MKLLNILKRIFQKYKKQKLVLPDKDDYHNGCYPKDISSDKPVPHIIMYLNWILQSEIASNFFIKSANFNKEELKTNKWDIIGLYNWMDGTISEDLLTIEGNNFTNYYYEKLYLNDLLSLFPKAKTLYHIENTWENFEKVRDKINKRFIDWKR